jgi:hypothetical protein
MQLRCKANQLCWIIKAHIPSNVGKIVTTRKQLGSFDQYTYNSSTSPAGFYWEVECSTELVTVSGEMSKSLIMPDLWLQPILPDEKALEYVLKSEVFTDDQVEQIKELILEGNYNHG